MRLGYNTNGFAHHRLEDALKILAELGYESVAITIDHHALSPYPQDQDRRRSIARECDDVRFHLERLKLRCVIETGARFLLDPRRKHYPTILSETADERNWRWAFIWAAIDIAQLLGAEAVSFWSGAAFPGATAEFCMHELVKGCRLTADEAQRRGVRLAFEPEPGMYIDTMDKFAELHKRVDHPAFGLTLDVGHLHCMGELPIAEHIECWKDRLWNVHIEDMRKGVHDHLMFGDGEMDFPPIFAALQSIGYEGGVHVELSRHSHDAVETARRALAFLRNLKN